jgi:hypothetical protein
MQIANVLKYYVELFLWFLVLCCTTALAFFDFRPQRTLTSPFFSKFSLSSALWTLSLLSHSLRLPGILFWPFTPLFCLLSFIYIPSEIFLAPLLFNCFCIERNWTVIKVYIYEGIPNEMTVLFVFAVGLFAYGFSCDTDVGTSLTVTVHCFSAL